MDRAAPLTNLQVDRATTCTTKSRPRKSSQLAFWLGTTCFLAFLVDSSKHHKYTVTLRCTTQQDEVLDDLPARRHRRWPPICPCRLREWSQGGRCVRAAHRLYQTRHTRVLLLSHLESLCSRCYGEYYQQCTNGVWGKPPGSQGIGYDTKCGLGGSFCSLDFPKFPTVGDAAFQTSCPLNLTGHHSSSRCLLLFLP